jgi:ribosome-associated translation inhibitor RaiA
MKINIEAPGHDNQAQLLTFYQEKLESKYAHFKFIHNIDVKIEKVGQDFEVGLQIKPEKGTLLYAKDSNRKEDAALDGVIKKMNAQIEKYKEKHYRSSHLQKRKT